MSDYTFVLGRIADMNLEQIAALGKRAGVPKETVRKIARLYVKDPKTHTIERLATALRKKKPKTRKKK